MQDNDGGGGGGGFVSDFATFVDDGNWHFLVGTYDGTDATIWIDGVAAASAGFVFTLGSTAYTFEIGGDCNGAFRYYDGTIDEVRVYNRALGATEIAALARAGAARIGASSVDLARGSSLEQGLVGHWTMDGTDTLATITDRSGQGNHGYFIGGATSSAKTIGVLGQALDFDGSSNHVALGDPSPLNFQGDSALSVTGWVKLDDTQNWPVLIAKQAGADPTGQYAVQVGSGSNNKPSLYLNTGSWNMTVEANEVLAAGSWYHIAATYDGTNSRIYINGALDNSASSQTGPIDGDEFDPIQIGFANGVRMNGLIDDLRVYNRTLTAAEVKQLYNLGQVKITQ